MRLHICKENISKQNIAKPIFLNLVQSNVSQLYLVLHTKYTNKTHSLTCAHTHTLTHSQPHPTSQIIMLQHKLCSETYFQKYYHLQLLVHRNKEGFFISFEGCRTMTISFSIFFTISDYILYQICMLNTKSNPKACRYLEQVLLSSKA